MEQLDVTTHKEEVKSEPSLKDSNEMWIKPEPYAEGFIKEERDNIEQKDEELEYDNPSCLVFSSVKIESEDSADAVEEVCKSETSDEDHFENVCNVTEREEETKEVEMSVTASSPQVHQLSPDSSIEYFERNLTQNDEGNNSFPEYYKVKKRERKLKDPVLCSICNKSFTRNSNLTKHQRIHTGERSFSCEICAKAFTFMSDLKRHMRIHTGEQPFSCNICNKPFAQFANLNSHLRIHSGERPFSCNICNKSFTELGHLKRHDRVHTGERPFTCDICKKSFTENAHLKRHERVHTGERPFSCDICHKSFSQINVLKRHNRIHMNNEHT